MKLKNYQEDVVLRAIEIALEDDAVLLADPDFVNDVAAYVLNRIPPRYVTSERGFLRLALDGSEDAADDRSLANIIELMMLVNRGLDLVRTRRPRSKGRGQRDPIAADVALRDSPGFGFRPGMDLVHNYPQMIGRVVHGDTGKPVFGARVSVHIDGDLVPPAQSGWENPYVTREETRGYFSFWPHPSHSDRETFENTLLFTVECDGFEPHSHVEKIVTTGSFEAVEVISGEQVLSLPPFSLVPTGRSRGSQAGHAGA